MLGRKSNPRVIIRRKRSMENHTTTWNEMEKLTFGASTMKLGFSICLTTVANKVASCANNLNKRREVENLRLTNKDHIRAFKLLSTRSSKKSNVKRKMRSDLKDSNGRGCCKSSSSTFTLFLQPHSESRSWQQRFGSLHHTSCWLRCPIICFSLPRHSISVRMSR